MSFHTMLYVVNALDYRTTVKLHDIKKTDSIWNQSFQITVEVRFQLDSVDGEKYSCRNTKISAKTNGKVFKSAVRL